MRSRLTDLLGIETAIVQAPMAGVAGAELVAAVANAGGLGSLPCAMLSPEAIAAEVASIRSRTAAPLNLNFFCHTAVEATDQDMEAWTQRLAPYYAELDAVADQRGGRRSPPFDDATCQVVEECRPTVVSFHFGLPSPSLVERVKATGARVMSSATSVAEARWLVDRGCDVVIAQGLEAGGHRGMFLDGDVSRQIGSMALVPQIVDAVDVPVVAAGGIGDARGVVAALALGADGVQLGTAFLRCPEATTSAIHREALAGATDDSTAVTNVFTGRPARAIVNRAIAEVGPLSDLAPPFPLAAAAMAPLRAAAEEVDSGAFTPLWSGQAAALCEEIPAEQLVRRLSADVDALVRHLAS